MIDLKKKDDDEPMFDPGLGFTIFPMARVRHLYYTYYQCFIYTKNTNRKAKNNNVQHFHQWTGILKAMNMTL